MKTIGIDPGAHGALALYDSSTGELRVQDLPMAVGAKREIDIVALQDTLAEWVMCEGADLALLEHVWGRAGDTAVTAGSLMRNYGQIEASLVAVRVRRERATPQKWKTAMKCPGKSKGTEAEYKAAIAARADEVFPHYGHLWRGKMGGIKLDRAEAALIAKYAATEFSK